MPDDLSSIEGLADKHRRVLARHHVTDLRGLVQADRRVIHRAMANLRPRPTLELISRWQDDARSKLEDTGTDALDWQQAASFVVIFSQRPQDGGWDRHVEVERTEVEPERSTQVWPGWDCAPVCAWMTSQLSQPGDPSSAPSAAEPAPAEAGALAASSLAAASVLSAAGLSTAGLSTVGQSAEAAPPNGDRRPAMVGSGSPPPAGRPRLRIDSAALIDAAGRTDVVTVGQLAAEPRTRLTPPIRVVLTVGGARPGTRLQAVARIQRPDTPGWNPRDPVAPSASGQAEFDLSAVPAGEHELSLIAWAPDASAQPVSVRLPRVTILGPQDE